MSRNLLAITTYTNALLLALRVLADDPGAPLWVACIDGTAPGDAKSIGAETKLIVECVKARLAVRPAI